MPKVHFDNSWGFDLRTACGRSLHVYYVKRPALASQNWNEVTCLACRNKRQQARTW